VHRSRPCLLRSTSFSAWVLRRVSTSWPSRRPRFHSWLPEIGGQMGISRWAPRRWPMGRQLRFGRPKGRWETPRGTQIWSRRIPTWGLFVEYYSSLQIIDYTPCSFPDTSTSALACSHGFLGSRKDWGDAVADSSIQARGACTIQGKGGGTRE
jgi:hypothetical protein